MTTNGSGGAKEKRKKCLSRACHFFEKQKENKVCVEAAYCVYCLPYLAMAYLPHIMKGAGLVRLLDEWNTDSVLVP